MGKNAKRRRKKKEKQEKKIKKKIKEKDQVFDWKSLFSRWDFWVYVVVFLALIAFPFYRNYVRSENMHKIDEAVIHTSMGDILLELYPEDAPKTVDNFVKLSRDGFYDGLTFHRVIEDFMIQGGDPSGDGTGGPGYTFEDEINDHKVVQGSLAMANSGPDTNGSQFFIVTGGDQPHLDGKHTVFGQVTSGLDVATEISKVETDDEDKPLSPVVIESIDIK